MQHIRDTTPAAEQVRRAAIRQLDPLDRLRQAFELSEAMRALALAGLRAAHPDCSERELVEQLLALAELWQAGASGPVTAVGLLQSIAATLDTAGVPSC